MSSQNKQVEKLAKLLTEQLSTPEQKLLELAPDPVSFVISRAKVNPEKFYQQLAEAMGLGYLSSIPAASNAAKTIAQLIPVQLVVDNLVYPFEQNDQLFIATHNPFVDQEVINKILKYTNHQQYQLVVAPKPLVWQAIALTYYWQLSQASEQKTAALIPGQSTKQFSQDRVAQLTIITIFVSLAIITIIFPSPLLLAWFLLLNVLYFVINPYKAYIFFRSFKPLKSITINSKQVQAVADENLPRYTILVPLKKEEVIIPKIVQRLNQIDYPKDKLDIKFVVEVDDDKTIAALAKENVVDTLESAHPMTGYSQLVKVPIGEISTKPRSCNFALKFALGAYTVIYDAEDKPDPDQLKKAVIGFQHAPLSTVCLQARLNYYNSRQNLLTRLFSLEYGFWFDFFLPGLREVDSPIPLGGTSNHFITSTLKKLGGWDAYNVTEDADLGLRIYRFDLKTAVINSRTLEEASSRLRQWIPQRTRWQKGFLMTFLVHIRHPIAMWKDLKTTKFTLSLLSHGGSFFLPAANPVLWLVFAVNLMPNTDLWYFLDIPAWVTIIAVANLVIGNLIYIVIHAIATIKNKRPDLILLTILLPIYWLLISLATYRATWQHIFHPYVWEKTEHGLNPKN